MNSVPDVIAAYHALTPEQIVALMALACLAFGAYVIRTVLGARR